MSDPFPVETREAEPQRDLHGGQRRHRQPGHGQRRRGRHDRRGQEEGRLALHEPGRIYLEVSGNFKISLPHENVVNTAPFRLSVWLKKDVMKIQEVGWL